MDDIDNKDPQPPNHKKPKSAKRKIALIAEAAQEIELERSRIRAESALLNDQRALREEKSRRPKWLPFAAQMRARFPDGQLADIAADIATGVAVASREQVTMLRDVLDRVYGRAPETHLIGQTSDTAATELSTDQLLAILDAPETERLVAGSVVVIDQAPETTEPTT